MSVGRLHRILSELIKRGHRRTKVTIYKKTFTHNLGEVDIHEVCGVNVQLVDQCDDDGGTKINRDGSESCRMNALLFGVSGFVSGGFVESDAVDE